MGGKYSIVDPVSCGVKGPSAPVCGKVSWQSPWRPVVDPYVAGREIHPQQLPFSRRPTACVRLRGRAYVGKPARRPLALPQVSRPRRRCCVQRLCVLRAGLRRGLSSEARLQQSFMSRLLNATRFVLSGNVLHWTRFPRSHEAIAHPPRHGHTRPATGDARDIQEQPQRVIRPIRLPSCQTVWSNFNRKSDRAGEKPVGKDSGNRRAMGVLHMLPCSPATRLVGSIEKVL